MIMFEFRKLAGYRKGGQDRGADHIKGEPLGFPDGGVIKKGEQHGLFHDPIIQRKSKKAIPRRKNLHAGAFFCIGAIVLFVTFALAGPAPLHVDDPAVQENFDVIFNQMATHSHNGEGTTEVTGEVTIDPSTDLTVNSLTATTSVTAGTTVTAATVTATTAITAPVLLAPYPFLQVQERQTSGTDGGTSVTGAFVSRSLNTISTNTIPGSSLSASTVTLPAGTYYVQFWAVNWSGDSHKTRLRQTSGTAATLAEGASMFAAAANAGYNTSEGSGVFTATGPIQIALQQRLQTASATLGLGIATNFGAFELYSQMDIWRIK